MVRKSSLAFLLLLFLSNCTVIPGLSSQKDENKEKTMLVALLFLAVNSGCSGDGSFWARNVTTNTSYCVRSTLAGTGTNVNLYVENGLSTGLDYSSIVNSIDSTIIPREKEAFGSPSDINQDSKVTILILDIKDGATSGSSFYAGFFDPMDFFTDVGPSSSLRSNEKEMLYIDGVELVSLRKSDMASGKPDTLLSTIAHEMQHLIRFQYELTANSLDDTWVNEGTSEVASDITGYGPQTSRIYCYNGSSSSCSGGIGGSSLFTWSSTIKNYAFAYTFMKYLYENSGATSTLKYDFLKKTVTGSGVSVRATNATNLMEIFKTASSFNSGVLTSTGSTMFKRLFAGFLAQSVNYNLTAINTFFGSTSATDISTVQTTYPLPTDLTSPVAIYSPAFPVSGSGPASFNLAPSGVYRMSGNSTGVTSGGADYVVVKNGVTNYLVFNGALSGSTQSGSASVLDSPQILIPELERTPEPVATCPQHIIRKNHEIHNAKQRLMPYKKAEFEPTKEASAKNLHYFQGR